MLRTILDSLHNRILLKIKKVSTSNNLLIKGKISIFGHGKIIFKSYVSINSGSKVNPIGGDMRTVLVVKKNAVLTIGKNTGISNTAIVCHKEITIGDFVKIGGGVKIYDTDFHNLDYKSRAEKSTDIGVSKPVKIGHYCFIGAHSIILKGVNVGNKSIIGAGSVVSKSIPESEIWAGNPARFIKKLSQ